MMTGQNTKKQRVEEFLGRIKGTPLEDFDWSDEEKGGYSAWLENPLIISNFGKLIGVKVLDSRLVTEKDAMVKVKNHFLDTCKHLGIQGRKPDLLKELKFKKRYEGVLDFKVICASTEVEESVLEAWERLNSGYGKDEDKCGVNMEVRKGRGDNVEVMGVITYGKDYRNISAECRWYCGEFKKGFDFGRVIG